MKGEGFKTLWFYFSKQNCIYKPGLIWEVVFFFFFASFWFSTSEKNSWYNHSHRRSSSNVEPSAETRARGSGWQQVTGFLCPMTQASLPHPF